MILVFFSLGNIAIGARSSDSVRAFPVWETATDVPPGRILSGKYIFSAARNWADSGFNTPLQLYVCEQLGVRNPQQVEQERGQRISKRETCGYCYTIIARLIGRKIRDSLGRRRGRTTSPFIDSSSDSLGQPRGSLASTHSFDLDYYSSRGRGRGRGSFRGQVVVEEEGKSNPMNPLRHSLTSVSTASCSTAAFYREGVR